MSHWIPRLDADALTVFMRDRFPPALFPDGEAPWAIEEVAHHRLKMRLRYQTDFLRPGGTISGPTMMMLADTAMYLLILSHIGPVELAVTTSLHIDFLRKPLPADLHATADMLKLGRRLAVGRVLLQSVGDTHPVAHAAVTYALPGPSPA